MYILYVCVGVRTCSWACVCVISNIYTSSKHFPRGVALGQRMFPAWDKSPEKLMKLK